MTALLESFAMVSPRPAASIPALRRVVSVVIPTFNRARYLRQCIESILNQTVEPLELIVVDDGSEDHTPKVVTSFGTQVRYFRVPNGGKPRALNFALQWVQGEYLWMFDDDDVALPNAIEDRLKCLLADATIGFVVTGHRLGFEDDLGRIIRTRDCRLGEMPRDELRLELMKGCFCTMQSMLVKTSLVREVGGFDPQLRTSEDYDMMLRLAGIAPFTVLEQPTFIFRQHDGLRGSKDARYSADSRVENFKRYDAIVGEKLRAALPLGAYLTPPTSCPLDARRTREALLNRMIVMASKGLIPSMLDDLCAALLVTRESGDSANRRDLEKCALAICTGYAYDAIAKDFGEFMSGIDRIPNTPERVAAIVYISLGLLRLGKSYPAPLWQRLRKVVMALRVCTLLLSAPLLKVD